MDWFATPQYPDPSPIEILLQRLDDVVEYCTPLLDVSKPATCFRTLRPINDSLYNRRHKVDAIVYQRRTQLGRPVVDRTLLPDERNRFAQRLKQGRVLAFLVDINLYHGMETGECGGYIDENNCPPADTWLLFADSCADKPANANHDACLFAWVPSQFEAAVQRAIDVNPECCLLWADQLRNPIGEELNRERTS